MFCEKRSAEKGHKSKEKRWLTYVKFRDGYLSTWQYIADTPTTWLFSKPPQGLITRAGAGLRKQDVKSNLVVYIVGGHLIYIYYIYSTVNRTLKQIINQSVLNSIRRPDVQTSPLKLRLIKCFPNIFHYLNRNHLLLLYLIHR